MNAFEEFPEGYEPTPLEVVLQADRRLRNHDQSNPNSLISLSCVPFEESDGTTVEMEFYKPTEYEYNGILYKVLFSQVESEHCLYDNNLFNLIVYLLLKDPNEEEYLELEFYIVRYGTANQKQLTPGLPPTKLDNLDEYMFLYDYAMTGVHIPNHNEVEAME
jgi:hypothetical protein